MLLKTGLAYFVANSNIFLLSMERRRQNELKKKEIIRFLIQETWKIHRQRFAAVLLIIFLRILQGINLTEFMIPKLLIHIFQSKMNEAPRNLSRLYNYFRRKTKLVYHFL